MQNIDLNKIASMDTHHLKLWALECETRFEKQFTDAYDLIEREKVKILYLSGPSCSGKTTSTKKLEEALERMKKNVVTVSTDDFFLDTDLAPRNRDGTPNYESFDFIDSKMLIDVVRRIISCEDYLMPRFDFKTKERVLPEKPESAPENTVVIVEGIHALNDKLIAPFSDVCTAGMYICPEDPIKLNSRMLLESTEIRFLRRLVRDKRHRATDASQTFAMWENVIEGEDLYISPFLKNADIFINSTFLYEPFIMRNQALPLLKAIGDDSIYRFKAQSLCERLERLFPLGEELISDTSLLNEFLR